jgi:hypothetical protein
MFSAEFEPVFWNKAWSTCFIRPRLASEWRKKV